MKGKPFGLDIGATTTKVVWMSQRSDGFELKAALTAPTPPKGMQSESPLDMEQMSQLLRKIVSEAKINTQLVNVSLPENHVYTRIIEMPILTDNELSSAIYWEAEQYIPVPLTSVTLDYSVLHRPAQKEVGMKMDVLLVAAPTMLVDKYQKILAMAGLTPVAVETEILSAVRALVLHAKPTDKNAVYPNTIIINIGAVSTSLAIVKSGIIIFTYSIPTGGNAINRAIAADFGFTLAQAEEYKKTYGISQDTVGDKIGQATAPILSYIVTEVKKALAFYNEKYKNESPMQQILLAGGTSKLPGINTFFAENCGIETAIANPWSVLTPSQTLPQEILESGPDYTVAVGLAMRDYE